MTRYLEAFYEVWRVHTFEGDYSDGSARDTGGAGYED